MPTYDEQVIDFLAAKENLGHALEIARLIPEVQQRLQIRFWDGLAESLRERLKGEDVAGWEVYAEAFGRDSSISIRPAHVEQKSPVYSVEQQVENQRLFYGIAYGAEQQPRLPELNKLLTELRESNPNRSGPDVKWWLAWWWTDTRLYDDSFYLRMAALTCPPILVP